MFMPLQEAVLAGLAVKSRREAVGDGREREGFCPLRWHLLRPAPFVHAATKAARLAFREAYALFVAAYREAADKLRKGNRAALFPIGSFPPALPFVGG